MRKRRETNFKGWIVFLVIVSFVIFTILVVKYINPYVTTLVLNFKGNKNATKIIIKPYPENNDISEFEKKLKDNNFSIDRINMSSNAAEIIVFLKGGPKLIYSRNKAIDWQINSTKVVITKLTIENKKPSQIDFRHEKPIVIF